MNELLFYSGILTSAFQRVAGSWPIAYLDYDGLCHGPSTECPQEIKNAGKRVPVQLKDALGMWSSNQARRCHLPICWIKDSHDFPAPWRWCLHPYIVDSQRIPAEVRGPSVRPGAVRIKESTRTLWIFQIDDSPGERQSRVLAYLGLLCFLMHWMRVSTNCLPCSISLPWAFTLNWGSPWTPATYPDSWIAGTMSNLSSLYRLTQSVSIALNFSS